MPTERRGPVSFAARNEPAESGHDNFVENRKPFIREATDTFGIIWPISFGNIWHTCGTDRFNSPEAELLLRR
jgi:hypothetical protein